MPRLFLICMIFPFNSLTAQFYYGKATLFNDVSLWITPDDAINTNNIAPARTLYPSVWTWKNIETQGVEKLIGTMNKRDDVLAILPVVTRTGTGQSRQYYLAIADSAVIKAKEAVIRNTSFFNREDFRIVSELAIDSVKYADPFYRYLYFKSLLAFTHRSVAFFDRAGTPDYYKWGVAFNECDTIMIPEPFLGNAFKTGEMLSKLSPKAFLLKNSNTSREARDWIKSDIPVMELLLQHRDSSIFLLKYLYVQSKGMIYFDERQVKPQAEPLLLKEDIAWFNAELKAVERKWLLEGRPIRQK